MNVVPITLRQACAFVQAFHRHNKPPAGHKFSIGVAKGGVLLGVVIVGRPVARHFDNGKTLEVNRSCTTGASGANSMLYAAAWRAAKAMGYSRLITYTQGGESGASLRGAGWVRVRNIAARGGWDTPSRYREDKGTAGAPRVLWEICGADLPGVDWSFQEVLR